MEKRIIRVGSRESALAVTQTRLVLNGIREKYPEIEFELVAMKTTGDKILDRTLDKVGGKGLFVKELDRALQDGAVELTIHSLKDVYKRQAGFLTDSNHSKARIKKVDTERLEKELDQRKIVVVAGFQGMNRYDDITTLGRGG